MPGKYYPHLLSVEESVAETALRAPQALACYSYHSGVVSVAHGIDRDQMDAPALQPVV
jgi:hypothetical protein